MKLIQLTRGKVAMVDDEDFELVSGYGKWTAHKDKNNWYAATTIRVGVNKRRCIKMHRLVMGVLEDKKIRIDHKNRNGLDNTRGNLRKATSSQNAMNRRNQKRMPDASKFKGVHKKCKRIYAAIRVNKILIKLGYFSTEQEAAMAYDEAANKYFGEFAYLNFPKTNAAPELGAA